jgi:hypothetical protein
MDMNSSQHTITAKQTWEEPAIILERPLEVVAQDGPTDDNWVAPSPWRLPGPLAASGGAGFCQ